MSFFLAAHSLIHSFPKCKTGISIVWMILVSIFNVQSQPCSIDSVLISNPTCASLCNGSITLFAQGSGQLNYTWIQFPNLDSNTVNGLCDGNYIVQISDTSGCQVTDTIVITEPDPLAFTFNANPTSCPGSCTGSITLIPPDTLPYTYHWPGYLSTGPILSGLCQGTYNAIVTNSNNCTVLISATVLYEDPFDISFVTSPSSCPNSCDGSATAIVSAPGVFNYQWLTGPIQNTQTANGLCIGNYVVTVTDSIGCEVVDSVIIDFLAPPVINSYSVSPVCIGGCDGIAGILTDSSSNYLYEWNISPPQFDSVATGLCSGAYSFVITDIQTGCMYSDSVLISDPDPSNISTIVSPSSCVNFCNGSAQIFSNAPSPLSYVWSSGSSTFSDSLLCPGLYTVTITDSLGCMESVIVSIDAQNVVTTSTNATCNTICDGTAEVIFPFPGSWTVNWSTVPAQQTSLATGLCQGMYQVSITDTSGCELTSQVEVNSDQPISLQAEVSDLSCFGECDGSINLNISGNGPFNLSWSTLPVQTSFLLSDLCDSSYIVQITDFNGCVFTDTFIVASPAEPGFNFLTLPNSCANICDAGVVAVPQLSLDYSIYWQTNPVQTGPVALGLCPGWIGLVATDSSGCESRDSVFIIDSPAIFPVNNVTDIDCYGNCTGFIICQPWGGTPGYTYLWSNGFTTPAINNVCEGNYTVTVTDSKGCTATETSSVIAPDSLYAAFSVIPSSCSSCNDGSITASVNGGTPPYLYIWSPGGVQGQTLDSLQSGLYNLCVVDDHSCAVCTDIFVTTFNSIEDHSASDRNLLVYPNPFSKHTSLTFYFNGTVSSNLHTVIYDLNGRQIDGFNVSRLTRNESELKFEIANINALSGIYIIKLWSDSGILATGKLILINEHE